MNIILVGAYSKVNRVMGREGRLPWRYVADLQHFRESVRGCTLVCGPKTAKEVAFLKQPVVVWHRGDTFENIIKSVKTNDIAIVGGAKIFELGLAHATTLILTEIQKEYSGDIYFPEIPLEHFKLINEYTHPTQSDLVFKTYKRISLDQAQPSTTNNHC